MVALWKESLSQTSEKAARSLADPAEYDNLFPERPATLRAQQFAAQQRARPIPAQAAAKLPVSDAAAQRSAAPGEMCAVLCAMTLSCVF